VKLGQTTLGPAYTEFTTAAWPMLGLTIWCSHFGRWSALGVQYCSVRIRACGYNYVLGSL